MKKQSFLNRLKKEGKLESVEPSEEIKDSYIEKSSNSIKASQILIKSELLEEAVSMAYYSMYYSLLALMFKCGIKCENHTGNILLLKEVFDEEELHKIISDAKEERIDKQYYVDFEITKKEVEDLIAKAQDFTIKIKLLIESLTKDKTDEIRKKFAEKLDNGKYNHIKQEQESIGGVKISKEKKK